MEPEFEGGTHLMRSGLLGISEWKVYFKLSQSSRALSAATAHLGGPDLFPTLADRPRDRAQPGYTGSPENGLLDLEANCTEQ